MSGATADIPANDTAGTLIKDMDLPWLARTTQRNFVRDVALFATVLGHPPDTATATG